MAAAWTSRSKAAFVASVTCLLLLNLVVFSAAYPETLRQDSGCCGNRTLAKDFSAFYTAAWRLVHDPGRIYAAGYVNDGESQIPPQPEAYKYLPSFLLIVLPFTALPYQEALTTFDVFQFLLLPFIAALVYGLTKEKGLAAVVVVAVVALLLPLPLPGWSISAPYYWQWGEGQSKVVETFLLLLSLLAGKTGRPLLSGAVLALSAFDPRFTLAALPLFLYYNRSRLRRAAGAGLVVLVATNGVLFDPPVATGFVDMLFSRGLSTPLYYYALIPLLTVLALTVIEARDIFRALRRTSIN